MRKDWLFRPLCRRVTLAAGRSKRGPRRPRILDRSALKRDRFNHADILYTIRARADFRSRGGDCDALDECSLCVDGTTAEPARDLGPRDHGRVCLDVRPEHSSCSSPDGAAWIPPAGVGLLLDEIERRGLLANTLVIVTSDHGEQFVW